MQIEPIRALISEQLDEVSQAIRDNLYSDVVLVNDIANHIVASGGKRLRPCVIILTTLCFGSNSKLFSTLATIIEYIHTATLLHDDVIDHSMLRRGQQTANAIWDNTASVLVGDFLFSRAFQLMVELNSLEIMALLAKTTNIIAQGEVLQLNTLHNPHTTEAEYMEVINRKTACLFGAASRGAALLCQANGREAAALEKFGLHLGLAFQIIDDTLDYEATQEELGKAVGDDLAEGKPTLPYIYALQHIDPGKQAPLQAALTHGDRKQLPLVFAALQETAASTYCYNCAKQHIETAKQQLGIIPDSKYKQALLDLADFAIARRY